MFEVEYILKQGYHDWSTIEDRVQCDKECVQFPNEDSLKYDCIKYQWSIVNLEYFEDAFLDIKDILRDIVVWKQ